MVAPRWPKGPLPWLAVFGMATGIAGAFFPETRSWPVIKQTFQIGITMFRSVFGYQLVMGAAVVAHVVEAGVTGYICMKNKVSAQHTLGWMASAIFIGYGAIYMLNLSLKQAA